MVLCVLVLLMYRTDSIVLLTTEGRRCYECRRNFFHQEPRAETRGSLTLCWAEVTGRIFVKTTKSLLLALVALVAEVALAQTPANDLLDSLGLARLKNYTTARVSSGNRFVYSNDDSKRIMPGEALEIANLTGPGMVTHISVSYTHLSESAYEPAIREPRESLLAPAKRRPRAEKKECSDSAVPKPGLRPNRTESRNTHCFALPFQPRV